MLSSEQMHTATRMQTGKSSSLVCTGTVLSDCTVVWYWYATVVTTSNLPQLFLLLQITSICRLPQPYQKVTGYRYKMPVVNLLAFLVSRA